MKTSSTWNGKLSKLFLWLSLMYNATRIRGVGKERNFQRVVAVPNEL